jgi:DNA-binding NarL/FixJ family response regulator
MINVLLADDHIMFREGLKHILAESRDILVKDEAGNCNDVISKVLQNGYDVLVLDISMPDKNGLEIINQLKESKPNLQILILSMHSEEQYAFRAFQAGASGYLMKDATPTELLKAIRKVSVNEKYITKSVAQKLAIAISENISTPSHKNLSNREFQVMCMIAKGNNTSSIAKHLSLCISTVSTIRSRILKKMNMKNNAEITYYAIKERLVT